MRRRCGFGVRSPTRAIQTLNTGLGSPTMWAQFNLGLLYANGRGVEQDNVQAHLWLNLAAAGSEPAARRTRGLLSTKMTRSQLAEADRLAREWQPKANPWARAHTCTSQQHQRPPQALRTSQEID